VVDVGSVKAEIVRGIEDLPRAGQFVACHPMAGSEKTGYEHSDADLYTNAWVIVTPASKNREGDIAAVEDFWRSLRARVLRIDAFMHDERVAHTSHAPHMISCLMVNHLNQYRRNSGAGDIDSFIGSGFRDMTRLAEGSPDMWRDIVALNRGNIAAALDSFVDEVRAFRDRVLHADDPGAAAHEFFTAVKSAMKGSAR
jgi:prephenate dehydrogenase